MLEQIINDLLDCHELTSCKDGSYWMNLWSSKHKAYQIESAESSELILCDLLDADSGNYETGEQHYIIKIPNRTSNKIKNINILIVKYSICKVPNTFYLNLVEILTKIKTFEFRLIKIKRLKEKIKI